ncbi:MAG: AmmeMemoRadiSam system radical SAM enzyme [Candidatus Margulisiibacteriota bacterium]
MQKKEALLYEKIEHKNVHCFLCPRHCQIAPGHYGYCGVRVNEDGKLYTLIYGVVSSIAADPIEKKPLFHFHPGSQVLSLGTYGCNMRCGHCQNWQIAHVVYEREKDELREELIPPAQLLQLAKKENCAGIAWTYNEPTIWFEYTLDGAKLFKENGLYTVYVTNGYITSQALDMIGPYLDAFRVDIKGFNNDLYKKLAKVPDFRPILEAAIRAKKKWNMHVECITNIIPTMNDDDKQLKDIASWIRTELGENTPWHVTRFMPYLEYRNLPATSLKTLEKARKLGYETGLRYVYTGNVPGDPGENTYCHKCKKLLIERMGYQIKQENLDGNRCGFCGTPVGDLIV